MKHILSNVKMRVSSLDAFQLVFPTGNEPKFPFRIFFRYLSQLRLASPASKKKRTIAVHRKGNEDDFHDAWLFVAL
jgi:hypothetical protein